MVRVAEHHSVDRRTRGYLERMADDLSLGGLFIRTSKPLAKGTKLRLVLRLTTDGAETPRVRANAIVRWRRRWGERAGMGVEFLDFSANGRDDLQRFVDLVASRPDVGKRLRPAP